jgi:hypothetical protein
MIVNPTMARKPDTARLSEKLVREDFCLEDAMLALRECVEYLDALEMAMGELHDTLGRVRHQLK